MFYCSEKVVLGFSKLIIKPCKRCIMFHSLLKICFGKMIFMIKVQVLWFFFSLTQGFKFNIFWVHTTTQPFSAGSGVGVGNEWAVLKAQWPLISFHIFDHSELCLASLAAVGQKVVMASFSCRAFCVFSSKCYMDYWWKQSKTKGQ